MRPASTWRRFVAVALFATIGVLASCRSKAPQHIPLGATIPDNVILQNLTATQNISSPSYVQPQATTGGQPATQRFTSQAAQAGSNLAGAFTSYVSGSNDGSQGIAGHYFSWGAQTAPGAIEGGPNYSGMMSLHMSGGSEAILQMSPGTNGLGGGMSGGEISCYVPLSIATEGNSPIGILPSAGDANPHGQAYFEFFQSPGDDMPAMALQVFDGSQPPANSGLIRLPWGNSTSGQELLDQRNGANSSDLSIVSRQSGVLTFGSLSEDNAVAAAGTCTMQVLNSSGAGVKAVGPFSTIANFASDAHKTWAQGTVWPAANDGWSAQLFASDTTSTAQATIASIAITSGTNAVTQLRATVIGRASGTGDFATFREDWAYLDNGNAITAPSGSQPAATDTGHSTGAGTSVAPQFSISGPDILIKATPWTSSATHWTVRVEQTVDTGAAAPPPSPPGSPVLWVRADLQPLGPVSSWADQSGHSNNLTSVSGSTGTPTNTATVGPGATLPAVVFSSSTWQALGLGSALVGTKNFTIAIVGQVTVTTGAQIFLGIGDPADGQQLSIATGVRDFTQGGIGQILDGAATTSWESWVYSSDASGNLSLLVNGAPQALSPDFEVALTPSAHTTVGSSFIGTEKLTGAIFEILEYNTFQNNASVYSYVHAITGL